MKEEKQMYENKKSCASSDCNGRTWESIDWNKCEQAVNKLQARIVKAQKAGKFGKVKALHRRFRFCYITLISQQFIQQFSTTLYQTLPLFLIILGSHDIYIPY